jgi:5'-3' exonuclease
MKVHLLDGTYELFRHHFGAPSHVTAEGQEVGATRAVLGSVLTLLDEGATHLGVATDHVIESFRNDLWPGYKTSAGMPPELLAQFGLLEDALRAMGVVVWPMVELEADDALASAAARAADDPRVEQVVILTPDKDLAQCVRDRRVVQFDRRARAERDEDGVVARFGVRPTSIPDWLALVGDSADGFPGLAGWGAKSASAVLARYGHLEEIPIDGRRWDGVGVRNPSTLAAVLVEHLQEALLFRRLATLRLDALDALGDLAVDALAWTGPTDAFADTCDRLESSRLLQRARALARKRQVSR